MLVRQRDYLTLDFLTSDASLLFTRAIATLSTLEVSIESIAREPKVLSMYFDRFAHEALQIAKCN